MPNFVRHVFSLDNHYVLGGQGDRIADVLAQASGARLPRLHRVAVESLPVCGVNADVLRHHGLDASSLRPRALSVLSAPRAELPVASGASSAEL